VEEVRTMSRHAPAPVIAAWVLVSAVMSRDPGGHASTITVDPQGGGDATDIQSGIDLAVDGDTVLVKPGEYVIVEPIQFNRLHNPSDRASPPRKDVELLSEAGAGVTILRMAKDPSDPSRGSVVVFSKGETERSVLDGFQICGGRGTVFGIGAPSCGGGILILRGAGPIVKACRIRGNEAARGGGVFCSGSAAMIGCTISENAGQGLALSLADDIEAPTFEGCTISDNLDTGIYCAGSSPEFRGSTISGNRGHGVYSLSSSPSLVNCLILGNQRDGVFATTTCQDPGRSVPGLIHCTVSGNFRGVVSDCFSSLGLRYCIVWGNALGSAVEVFPQYNGKVVAFHSSIEGDHPWRGTGNTNLDPLFLQPGLRDLAGTPDDPSDDVWIAGDYRLQAGSPALDVSPSYGPPYEDILGRSRPCGAGVDMGAYELGDCAAQFRRGDATGDGRLDISDPIRLLGDLFLGETALLCLDAADVDDSGTLDITDAVYSLSFQFLGGEPPPGPFPGCGIEEPIDGLDCQSYPGCQ